MDQVSEVKAVADVVRKSTEPRVVQLAQDEVKGDMLLVPNGQGGFDIHDVKELLEHHRSGPERRTGTAVLGDLDSFIAHVQRFQDAGSALFGDLVAEGGPSLLAVLDYHWSGTGKARHGVHRAKYAFPLSDEFKAWMAMNGKAMAQAAFAEFIETRLPDVADPSTAGESAREVSRLLGCEYASPSKLLELSRGLSVRVGQHAKQHVNLQTGETQIAFASAHQDEQGAPLKVPGAILLALPVFRGGAAYQVPARLRYRVSEGAVSWFYQLYRPESYGEHAFREACDRAKSETKVPLFMGKPEA